VQSADICAGFVEFSHRFPNRPAIYKKRILYVEILQQTQGFVVQIKQQNPSRAAAINLAKRICHTNLVQRGVKSQF